MINRDCHNHICLIMTLYKHFCLLHFVGELGKRLISCIAQVKSLAWARALLVVDIGLHTSLWEKCIQESGFWQ